MRILVPWCVWYGIASRFSWWWWSGSGQFQPRSETVAGTQTWKGFCHGCPICVSSCWTKVLGILYLQSTFLIHRNSTDSCHFSIVLSCIKVTLSLGFSISGIQAAIFLQVREYNRYTIKTTSWKSVKYTSIFRSCSIFWTKLTNPFRSVLLFVKEVFLAHFHKATQYNKKN